MVNTTFRPIKVGGGGYMRTINIAPDNSTLLCNSDVAGCWLYNSGTSTWTDLLNQNLGFSISGPGNYAAYGMACAPSQPTTIYMYTNDGFLYRSLNRGASFVKLTNFASAPNSTNNGFPRFYAPRMAVDPINPDVVYICTEANGVFVTTNGTSGSGSTPTFAAVSGIAVATDPAGYLVCFDKDGGTTTGSTNIAYIFSNGTGCYRRTTPGGAFSLLSSGTNVPGGASHMMVAPTTSILYVCDITANLHKCTAGTWANTTAPGISPFAVAIDPTQAGQRIAVIDTTGVMRISTDAASTWATITETVPNLSPQIPWLAATGDTTVSNSRSVGDIVFDPNGLLYLCDGIGIWTCIIPNSGSYQWTSQTQGIENLVTNGIVISPNVVGKPSVTCWDRSVFYISSPGTYSAAISRPNSPDPLSLTITMTWGMDWASSDKKTLVAHGFWNSPYLDMGETSSNDGATWTLNPPTSNATWTSTTNGATAAGGTTLSFNGTVPFPTSFLAQVSNSTHPTSIPAGTLLFGNSGNTTMTLNNQIAAPGVSSGDTIVMKFASSPYMVPLATNAQTVSGAVLHFASVPAYIQPGMFMTDYSNGNALVGGGSPAQVLSISGGDVTMNQSVLATVQSGDVIFFTWGTGGAIAAASSTNWVVTLGQDASFPAVTADGGATWSIIDIAGTPRIGTGTVTNGSTDVTNLSYNTSNVVVGASFVNSFNQFPGGTTVASILSANSFRASAAATGSTNPDLIEFIPSGWGHANYLNLKNVAADRVTANTFYLYNYVTGKVYTSTASGANGTWSIANSSTNLLTLYQMNGGQNAAMKSVPFLGGTNTAGHLFMTNSNIASNNPSNPFIRSTDGGVTWSQLANIAGVGAFGFGAAKPGNSYPAVYVWGVVGGTLGMYRSDDNCANWIQLGTDAYPMGTVQGVSDIDGDKLTYGTVYLALGSNGWAMGSIDSATFGFSVITDSGQRRTKMIGY